MYIAAKADLSPKVLKKSPNLGQFKNFMKDKYHTVPLGVGKKVYVDVSLELYIISHGFLYCTCCKMAIDWDNRSRHMGAQKHVKLKQAAKDLLIDIETARPMTQQRISEQNLDGKTYSDGKIDSTLMWLKIACAGNWSLRSIEKNKVRFDSIQIQSFISVLYEHCSYELLVTTFTWSCFQITDSWTA